MSQAILACLLQWESAAGTVRIIAGTVWIIAALAIGYQAWPLLIVLLVALIVLILATALSLALILACAEFLLSVARSVEKRLWLCVALLASWVAAGCSCRCPLPPTTSSALVALSTLGGSIFTLSRETAAPSLEVAADWLLIVRIGLECAILTLWWSTSPLWVEIELGRPASLTRHAASPPPPNTHPAAPHGHSSVSPALWSLGHALKFVFQVALFTHLTPLTYLATTASLIVRLHTRWLFIPSAPSPAPHC